VRRRGGELSKGNPAGFPPLSVNKKKCVFFFIVSQITVHMLCIHTPHTHTKLPPPIHPVYCSRESGTKLRTAYFYSVLMPLLDYNSKKSCFGGVSFGSYSVYDEKHTADHFLPSLSY
jgi:hypothetical protein